MPAIATGPGKTEPYHDQDILIKDDLACGSVVGVDDYAKTTNGTTTASDTVLSKTSSSQKAGFEFSGLSQSDLPTLHHIVSRIQELPVLDVVSATVIEEEGAQKTMKAFAKS